MQRIFHESSKDCRVVTKKKKKKKKKKKYLRNVVVSNINIYCLYCLNVDGHHICWALLYIKLYIDNHCHKNSTDCKYNITLWFYKIFKAGKFKGLKSHIVKKNNLYKTKECIHRQHFADMKFA